MTHNKQSKYLKKIAVDSGSGLVGAGVGLLFAGPVGALVGGGLTPVLTDVLGRFLSEKEKSRIQAIAEIAQEKIKKTIDEGIEPTKNASDIKIAELFEGTLLAAKDNYEDKKLPLLANLFAAAPFTNTPIDNMVQTLISAEQLSYRELCVLAVIANNDWGKNNNPLGLRDKPLLGDKKVFDEKTEGVYQDLNHLLVLGFVGQVFSKDSGPAVASGALLIAPAKVILQYPGRLLVNGLELHSIDSKDLEEIVKILS